MEKETEILLDTIKELNNVIVTLRKENESLRLELNEEKAKNLLSLPKTQPGLDTYKPMDIPWWDRGIMYNQEPMCNTSSKYELNVDCEKLLNAESGKNLLNG